MQFTQAIDLYLTEVKSRRLSPRTSVFYRERLDNAVKFIGDKPIKAISLADIRSALASTSAGSADHLYRVLHSFFNFLVRDEIVPLNPMARIKKPRVTPRIIEPLSEVDIKHCYNAAKADRGYRGIRDAAIFATLVGLGLRRSELCGLKEADVRLDDGIMLVNGKGGKQRLVPVPPKLVVILARYVIERRATTVASRPCDRFFRGRHGRAITPDALTQMVRCLGHRAGVKLHPHKLRHSWASYYSAQDGSDVLVLQALAGWSTLSMANRYVKPSQEKMARAMETSSALNVLK